MKKYVPPTPPPFMTLDVLVAYIKDLIFDAFWYEGHAGSSFQNEMKRLQVFL
jgi:hypothetical protein